MGKKILLICAALILGFFIAPGSANAQTSAAVDNCNGHTLHSADNVVVRNSDIGAVGSVQLCRDGDNWFAMIISHGPMPSGHWANAILRHYENGVPTGAQWSCDSPGGNGHVLPGQTWCMTPKIYSNATVITFKALGYEYFDESGGWDVYADGATLRCNKHVGCIPGS